MPIKITVPDVVLVADKKDLKKLLREAGKEVIQTAQKLIRNSIASGAIRSGHQASAPGQPPANQTGNLAQLLSLKVNSSGTGLTVTDNAFYALALEAGGRASTRKGGKDKRGRDISQWLLEPRPFLSLALDEMEDDLGERMAEALLAGIKLKETKK